MGNTHETYMLINTNTDLSSIFPPSTEVRIRDIASGKHYLLKSAEGREFRVNQMGDLYRDYNVLPGDEIIITKVENESASDICVNIKKYQRVVLLVGSNGTEIVNIDRLKNYSASNRTYRINIFDRGNQNTLVLSFKESRKKRSDSPNTTDYYTTEINGQALANGTYYLTLGSSPALSMLPKSEYNVVQFSDNIFHSISTYKKNNSNYSLQSSIYSSFITAIKSKPFLLLAGISGTGKSRIVREFAFKSCPKFLQDKAGTTPGNYCMIEVKPNWHDSTELLGYYSRLGKAGYQFTKFVKFLVKAKMFPTVPFFVCLDEMNLAPVEQYFAEILSILETRKHPKNEETGEVDMNMVKTEPIIDSQYFRELSEMPHSKNAQTGEPFSSNLTDRGIYLKLFDIETESDIDEEVGKRTDLTTEGLTLPDNVVIIGTVNMDDTTHQFSRKVIDRAMTIEMNGGNLRNMFGGSKNLEYLSDEEQQKWQNAFTRRYVTADEVLDAHSDLAEELVEKLPAQLEEINKVLKGTPFEVSYRVLNELTIMVGVMLDEGKELDDAIAQSVNNILLMKILPRIEGDAEMFALSREYKTKVGITYDNRLEWLKELAPDIKETLTDTESGDDDTEVKADTVKEHQPTAKDKIQEMIDRLNNQEFTRFWP
jgi:hypothetical protein